MADTLSRASIPRDYSDEQLEINVQESGEVSENMFLKSTERKTRETPNFSS